MPEPLLRAGSWAKYKLSCGYTLWDNSCGVLPDLEETLNWKLATMRTRQVERMVDLTDRQAYHGTIVAWCGADRPVVLRQGHYRGLN